MDEIFFLQRKTIELSDFNEWVKERYQNTEENFSNSIQIIISPLDPLLWELTYSLFLLTLENGQHLEEKNMIFQIILFPHSINTQENKEILKRYRETIEQMILDLEMSDKRFKNIDELKEFLQIKKNFFEQIKIFQQKVLQQHERSYNKVLGILCLEKSLEQIEREEINKHMYGRIASKFLNEYSQFPVFCYEQQFYDGIPFGFDLLHFIENFLYVKDYTREVKERRNQKSSLSLPLRI